MDYRYKKTYSSRKKALQNQFLYKDFQKKVTFQIENTTDQDESNKTMSY